MLGVLSLVKRYVVNREKKLEFFYINNASSRAGSITSQMAMSQDKNFSFNFYGQKLNLWLSEDTESTKIRFSVKNRVVKHQELLY